MIVVFSLISTGPKKQTLYVTVATERPKGLQRKQYHLELNIHLPFSKLSCSDCRSWFHYFMQIHHIHNSYSWIPHRRCLTVLSHHLHTILEAFPYDYTSSFSTICSLISIERQKHKKDSTISEVKLLLSKWQAWKEQRIDILMTMMEKPELFSMDGYPRELNRAASCCF